MKTIFKGLSIGIFMGIADLVPGTSGGTLALITGIYPRLIQALSSLPTLLQISIWTNLSSEESKRSIKKADFSFLIPIGIGMLSSIYLFSQVIGYLIEEHSVILWAFFFLLILFSIIDLFHPFISSLTHVALLCLGTVISLSISTMGNIETTGNLIKVFFSGMLAISAMILPGISGALILLLLGEYKTMLDALKNHDFTLIIVFTSGCLLGILIAIQLLSWVVSKHRQLTTSFFCGFMLGTLPQLWPWRMPYHLVAEYTPFFKSNNMALLSPLSFQKYSGHGAMLWQVLLVLVFSAAISFVLHYQNKDSSTKYH